MSQVLKATVGWADQSGRGYQQHLVWCEVSRRWLLIVVLGSDTTKIRFYINDQLDFTKGTWEEAVGSPYTFVSGSYKGGTGCHLSCFYKNISQNDVIHVDAFYDSAGSYDVLHLRCVLSGRTITVSSETALGLSNIVTSVPTLINSNLAADNKPKALIGSGTNLTCGIYVFANADLGTSWTPNTPSASATSNLAASEIGGGVTFADNVTTGYYNVFEDASDPDPTSMKALTGGANANLTTSLGFTALVAGADPNDFNAIDRWRSVLGVATSPAGELHAVMRTGANTYTHRRTTPTNITTWAAGQSIPNQNSKAGGGLFMACDTENVWLFVIDSDAANTVRYIKWSASANAWDAAWSVLESSTKTRTNISGARYVQNQLVGVVWSEVNGVDFDVAGATLNVGAVDQAGISGPGKSGWDVQRNMQLGGTLLA